MKAVILAGGLGTRLRPVTFEIPKPLIPIQGKTLTEHNIDCLKEAGVDEVYLSIGYMADKIRDYFKGGKRFGVKIRYLVEKEPLGTGGWMHMIRKPKEDFIVINGDNLSEMDLKELMEFHKRNNATVSIMLTKVDDVTHFGIARMDGDRIVEFVEKPSPESAPSNYANSGFYVFSPSAFKHMPKGNAFMLENELFPELAKKGLLFGMKSDAKWYDTGTFERWYAVIKEWKK